MRSPSRWWSRFCVSSSQAPCLYRTEDLVQYGRDGAVHFIGQKDLQVKICGQCVELTEIEFYLHQSLLPFARQVVIDVNTYINSPEIIFGVVSSGRGASVRGIEKILGPTIASTPLRVLINPTQELSSNPRRRPEHICRYLSGKVVVDGGGPAGGPHGRCGLYDPGDLLTYLLVAPYLSYRPARRGIDLGDVTDIGHRPASIGSTVGGQSAVVLSRYWEPLPIVRDLG
ncbi:hypothetical protein BDV28DRAFT_152505 [Aspergillus coremiiformis]|uniref:Uncharacterized protein n=1 Tax=Aspergillus coremiiformis TaxID=138285 RepID=A0A5N6YTE8_9EURO|nr:hypothetical protein BDV28DRAFT_152505 [Aspergillus coremiiformis]